MLKIDFKRLFISIILLVSIVVLFKFLLDILTESSPADEAIVIAAYNKGETLSCGWKSTVDNKRFKFNGTVFYQITSDLRMIKVFPSQCSLRRIP